MDTSLVVTVLGPDRPGLVEVVSQTIAEHAGSWQESRMARLAGRFAGVLLVRVDESRAAALQHMGDAERMMQCVRHSSTSRREDAGWLTWIWRSFSTA